MIFLFVFISFHQFSDDDVDDVGNIFYSCFNVGLFSLVWTYLGLDVYETFQGAAAFSL